jgi:hypothetical protein
MKKHGMRVAAGRGGAAGGRGSLNLFIPEDEETRSAVLNDDEDPVLNDDEDPVYVEE